MAEGKKIGVDDLSEEVGGSGELRDFIDSMYDSGDIYELFETGSVTVATPKGKRVIEISIYEEA